MIEETGLIQCPQRRIFPQVDAGSPILKPNVMASVQQVFDKVGVIGWTKQIPSYARPMDQQDRTFGRRTITPNLNDITLEAVRRNKRHNTIGRGCRQNRTSG
jgi:hypothetical protein